jgi:hypothetical protein
LPESTQVVSAPDVPTAAAPTLRFQRRLQRLHLPGKDLNQHEGAGAARPGAAAQ